jgi:hypothetical protein
MNVPARLRTVKLCIYLSRLHNYKCTNCTYPIGGLNENFLACVRHTCKSTYMINVIHIQYSVIYYMSAFLVIL